MPNNDRNTDGHDFGSMNPEEHKEWVRDEGINEVERNTTQNVNRENRNGSGDTSNSKTINEDSLERGQVNRKGREEWGGYKGY